MARGPVDAVEDVAGRPVPLQHGEHVPRHLEDRAGPGGGDRRGPGGVRQAGHLAEDQVPTGRRGVHLHRLRPAALTLPNSRPSSPGYPPSAAATRTRRTRRRSAGTPSSRTPPAGTALRRPERAARGPPPRSTAGTGTGCRGTAGTAASRPHRPGTEPRCPSSRRRAGTLPEVVRRVFEVVQPGVVRRCDPEGRPHRFGHHAALERQGPGRAGRHALAALDATRLVHRPGRGRS